MRYNTEYIDVKYSLINAFLIEAKENIVDISYSLEDNRIVIQVVLLEGTILENGIRNRAVNNLINYNVQIKEIFISKNKFNESRGEWLPRYYTWLPFLLFSKAELL